MTNNQLTALRLQEDRRHNLEDESISKQKNKIEKYKAKTARGQAIAGVITDLIPTPGVSLRFSKVLGGTKK